MKARTEAIFRFTAPVRAAIYRFAFLSLIGVSILLMMLSKAEVPVMERLRMAASDAFAPVFEAIARPAEAINAFADEVRDMARLRDENHLLKAELARVAGWQDAARRLDAENQSLRNLLNYREDPRATYRAARVIADSGGSFMRSLLVSAGTEAGVEKGQAVASGEGLIGRVTEVGARTARVLLLTDLNSRIPVVVERTRDRAVLAGDNTATPRLLYLPQDVALTPGDRVVTSGQGGSLPPGLPIGIVSAVGEHGVQVAPFADWGRIEFVRIVDYGPMLLEERAGPTAGHSATAPASVAPASVAPSGTAQPQAPAPQVPGPPATLMMGPWR